MNSAIDTKPKLRGICLIGSVESRAKRQITIYSWIQRQKEGRDDSGSNGDIEVPQTMTMEHRQ